MSLICPKCQTEVPTRDNVHYGTHFAKVTDARPCEKSGKVIKFDERPTKEREPLKKES